MQEPGRGGGWGRKQFRGFNSMVDADHLCTEDIMASRKTAIYLVFDREPVTIGKYGVPSLAEPIYKSDYFYTE